MLSPEHLLGMNKLGSFLDNCQELGMQFRMTNEFLSGAIALSGSQCCSL